MKQDFTWEMGDELLYFKVKSKSKPTSEGVDSDSHSSYNMYKSGKSNV